jgi:PPOX class probable F420-dependent enzyme
MDSLDNAQYVSLRTFRRSGVPVDTPVWFAPGGSKTYYVFSAANAGKVKRLRLSSRAQLATCDMRGGSLGEWQDCEAYLTEDTAEIAGALQALRQKYGWQMVLTDFFSRLSGRYHQRAYIRIET